MRAVDRMKILPSIILVAAAANVGTALAPRGRTRRTVLFAVSLATLLALILPILSALGDLPALPETLSADGETVIGDPTAPARDATSRALAEEIARRFGVTPLTIAIELPAENDPGAIRVTLAKDGAGVKEKIAAWLKTESNAAVTVVCEEDTG